MDLSSLLVHIVPHVCVVALYRTSLMQSNILPEVLVEHICQVCVVPGRQYCCTRMKYEYAGCLLVAPLGHWYCITS